MTVKMENIGIKYIVGDFRNIGFKDYLIQKIKKTIYRKRILGN